LAIAEMEALILSDMQTFNDFYGTKASFTGNPMMQKDPKATLQNLSKDSKKGKYDENHAPDIFKKLDFNTVYKQHKGVRSFQAFADELKKEKIIDFKIYIS
jgi:hypothetical protein